MYPPPQGFDLDIEALSGICGSVSIACWVVVFSPQIIENFHRRSAEGLSVVFLVTWLVGDVFNILGAVLQGVLPTMIILAVYYTLADIVLLGQFFYYEGFTLKDKVRKPKQSNSSADAQRSTPDERTSLLQPHSNGGPAVLSPAEGQSPTRVPLSRRESRRESIASMRDLLLSIDATHLSPVTPLLPEPKPNAKPRPTVPRSVIRTVAFNAVIIALVCAAGVLGWYLSPQSADDQPRQESETVEFNILGQIFGYTCAALYLGSRIPQLLLNYRRKSTEGISMLFFLFACIGNVTYVFSIFAYAPRCLKERTCLPGEAGHVYGKYILVNLSWLIGSFGTLLLDAGVFVQYFMYMTDIWKESDDEHDVVEDTNGNDTETPSNERRGRRSVQVSFENNN